MGIASKARKILRNKELGGNLGTTSGTLEVTTPSGMLSSNVVFLGWVTGFLTRAGAWRRGSWCPAYENRESWGSLVRGALWLVPLSFAKRAILGNAHTLDFPQGRLSRAPTAREIGTRDFLCRCVRWRRRDSGRRCRNFEYGQVHGHNGARVVGVDFEGAAELADAFPHASDSHSGSAGRRQVLFLFRRDTLALVGDLHNHFLVAFTHANSGGATFGVAVNIREALLDHAKDSGL